MVSCHCIVVWSFALIAPRIRTATSVPLRRGARSDERHIPCAVTLPSHANVELGCIDCLHARPPARPHTRTHAHPDALKECGPTICGDSDAPGDIMAACEATVTRKLGNSFDESVLQTTCDLVQPAYNLRTLQRKYMYWCIGCVDTTLDERPER